MTAIIVYNPEKGSAMALVEFFLAQPPSSMIWFSDVVWIGYMGLVGFIGLVRLVGLVSLGGMVGRLGSRSVGLVGLRLEEARWSGKMRKSPGQDDLHGEEEMDEQCQLNLICKLDKTVDLQVKKKRLGLFLVKAHLLFI